MTTSLTDDQLDEIEEHLAVRKGYDPDKLYDDWQETETLVAAVRWHHDALRRCNAEAGKDEVKLKEDAAALAGARAEIEQLRKALKDLMAEQNGPPLLGRHEISWNAAMEKARAALS